jgi:hypothetical protein
MARCKHVDTSPRFLPVDLARATPRHVRARADRGELRGRSAVGEQREPADSRRRELVRLCDVFGRAAAPQVAADGHGGAGHDAKDHEPSQ